MSRIPTKQYPRSQPYRPPEEAAPGTGRLRPWTFLMLGAAAVLLVVTVAASVFWVNKAAAEPPPEAAQAAAPAPEKSAAPEKPAAAKKAALRPAKQAPALAVNEQLLEGLGGMSAAHLYQSFLNIGLLADGVENETYSPAEAEKMLGTVTGLMDLMDRNLQKLNDTGLDAEDRQSVEKIRGLSEKLRAQAAALRAYWASEEEAAAERYHRARDEAWAGLSELVAGQTR
jgi:hypothetical protein